ncbi:DUF3658 domain-containing protein [Burkholderia contaminans]|uniref:DUF3658 domain-containing protein n=1 Tax=Burkholderia contaminans TaxID=488447 RepID=UPI001CF525DA|nr:DUF3658 domain-containing protein [Burkholderia contaminans]MCA7917825.1 DUF3658 domain-containing protein [Burkholderia contaminans]UUX41390.1 DUF3658 domain-containing protein [Burkholderia contaminans]
MKALHTTFSEAALESVSPVVLKENPTESCILINGDWHFGPLKNRDTQTLTSWFIENFDYAPENLITDKPHTTVDEFDKIYAWVDLFSSDEHANFLHWISVNRPFQLFLIPSNSTHNTSTPSNSENLIESLNHAIEKKSTEIDAYAREWNTLINENSDFRLINPTGRLQSFTSSSFDKYVIDSVTTDWEPSPLPVLRVMENLRAERQQFPGDIFLYQRLEKLATKGVIEKQTDSDITQTQIRLTTS